MPNTAKSHGLYPFAAAAREKIPRQQQRSAYEPPQSTRPFMTMTATALQAPLNNSHVFYQQQQTRRYVAPPAHQDAPYLNSYQQQSPMGYSGLQQQHAYSSSRAMDADRVYEKLQPPARTSSNVSAAWRDEIEHRALAGRSGASVNVGMKRPVSQRPVYQQQYEAESVSPVRAISNSSSFPASYKMGAFTPPSATTGTLPTLSCLLQRNSSSDASSSSASSSRQNSMFNDNNKDQYNNSSSDQYINKRQRMFVQPPQTQRPKQQRAVASLPLSRSHPQAADLVGADNEHLRKILEQEVAFYNQRSHQPSYESPAAATAVSSRRYEAEDEVKTSAVVYSNNNSNSNSRKPTFYGSRPFIASSSYSRVAQAPTGLSPRSPPARRTESDDDEYEAAHCEAASSRPAFSNERLVRYSNYANNQRTGPQAHHASSETSLKYSNSIKTSSDDSSRSPRHEQLDRNTMDRDFVGKQELSTHSPPRPARRQQYVLDTQPSQRFAPSAAASHNHQQQQDEPTSSIRIKSSGFRFSSASDKGESAIEAASGLLEERSPSKRESITKLLLKSKEFLKAKSLVRNRNNEIDWVATFLNVGFESSSIYSLMCPLRKGRWKAEEEKYTMELLRLIESGAIRLRHGQSIRGFIAKKLHSDDMRVLKKLSNCKMFHFARSITPHMAEEEEIDEEVEGAVASLGRLEKLRSEFLRSVQLEALVAVRKYLSDSSIRELLNGRD